ncbi:PP2C family protein-serine/threonine phosphatase [Pelagibius sp.]
MVVDGMGGHAGGRLASRIAVREAHKRLVSAAKPKAVAEALEQVNQELFTSMHQGTEGMGATIAGVRIHRGNAVAFNVGDSRVYAFEEDRLMQISVDDAFRDKRNGRKVSSAITQSLGGGFRRRRIDAHVIERDVDAPQRFLICSDGLSDLVQDYEIEEVMRKFPHDYVSRMLGHALDRGGRDNISIISVRVL